MKRTLAYYKGRQVQLRNLIAITLPGSSYYTDIHNAYKFARNKVHLIESKILVRRL